MNKTLPALAALGLLWLALDARSAPATGTLITRTVEYSAQCFVDNQTERKWCERRDDIARLVDCSGAESKPKCRLEHMNAMGQAGWRFVNTGGGTYAEWYDAPLFFYERVVMTEGG